MWRTATAALLVGLLAVGGQPAWADEVGSPETPTETVAETVVPVGTPAEGESTEPGQEPVQEPVQEPEEPVTTPAETPAVPAGEKTAAEIAAPADLRLTAAFDRAEYEPASELPLTVTVENVGGTKATGVSFQRTGGNVSLDRGWEQLGRSYDLEPGGKLVFELGARQHRQDDDYAEFTLLAYHSVTDPTPADNRATTRASVPQLRGRAAGVLYTDANRNGRFDAGEQRAGQELRGWGGRPSTSLNAVTDQDGRFAFENLPVGEYTLTLADSSIVVRPGFGRFTVQRDATTELAIPTAPPVSEVLDARMEFDRDSYQRDDQVNVLITLTNKGIDPLTNVIAVCNRVGEAWVLDGTGPGWAPLDYRGSGTTLAAGETKNFVIPDVVPNAAYEGGRLRTACEFGNDGANSDGHGYVSASDNAKVVGARGSAKGMVTLYTGQSAPLPGVTLLLLDQTTKQVVTRTQSDATGWWQFDNVPVGDYDVLVTGPYQPRRDPAGFVLRVHGGYVSQWGFEVVDGPLVEEPRPVPNIKVTASFDKPSYDINDQIKVTVKVANVGTAIARYVRFENDWSTRGQLAYDLMQWGGMYSGGVEIAPGQEHVVTLTGVVGWSPDDVVRLAGAITTPGDVDPADNRFDLSAAVTHRTGTATTVAYGDLDGDAAFDEGEGLPNVRITFEGGLPRRWFEGTTDASGRFRLEGAPAGKYVVRLHDEKTGWVRAGTVDLVVQPDQEVTVHYEMVRPLSDQLHASLEFDRDSYGQGDRVQVAVKLWNTGSETIRAKAFCGSAELPAVFNDAAWGPLDWHGPGVDVGPGETKSFVFDNAVPEYAAAYGMFGAWCSFGPESVVGLPQASDVARVPGQVWSVSGRVLNGTGVNPPAVPNVTIVLLDFFTNKPVARAVADGNGEFAFTDIPVGYYTPVVVGPWKFNTNWGPYPMFKVIAGGAQRRDIHVDPGPAVADPGYPETPQQPGVNPPAEAAATGGSQATGGSAATGAGASPVLAATGASVTGLGLIGLLVLAAGAGAVFAGRRRTA